MKVDLQLYKDFYSWDKYKEGAEFNFHSIIYKLIAKNRMPIDGRYSTMVDYSDEDYMEYVEVSEFCVEIPTDFYYVGGHNNYINEDDICDLCYQDFKEHLTNLIPKFGFKLKRATGDVLLFVDAEENKNE